MSRFKLNKKLSQDVKGMINTVLALQEERCPVVKKQLELALMDPRFAAVVSRCRDTAASFSERDRAWEELMEMLPSRRLDFASMRQDAVSYYGDESEAVDSGLVSEVVRETYDLMTQYLYSGRDFSTASYNITGLSERSLCRSDGLHHFFCDVVFGDMEADFSWGTQFEPLSVDKHIYFRLYDQFERFEFGWWKIVECDKSLYFGPYEEGSEISGMRMRKSAVRQKIITKPQPFLGEHVRRCAQLMLDNPGLKQTAFKEKAVAEDSFGLGDKKQTADTAVLLYKRLSTLHEPILAMIPEMNSTDVSLINTVARMRADYMFYLFMSIPFTQSAGMTLMDEANRFIQSQLPGGGSKEPVPTAFEAMAGSFLSSEEGRLSLEDMQILDDMMDFVEDAGLIGGNAYGQLVTTPKEMTPRLLKTLLDHGYGAYVRALLGQYKYERMGTGAVFLEGLMSLLDEEDLLHY
ncbi:BrxA family protein [Eubacterium sp. 1001713B170207_170306_E7]|uniref:BrxA family protein n=1 Tax=Eubacterium sp. 1001713B170207_170306_E7 TaxID=2787097 RepID=UPI00189A8A44|nr:BrxA family protein [Eubacterium sp. 1001713B170207_170306_E7]